MSDHPQTEGDVAEVVSGLLWAFTEGNNCDLYGWRDTQGYDLGDVEIITNTGTKFVLTVSGPFPADDDT